MFLRFFQPHPPAGAGEEDGRGSETGGQSGDDSLVKGGDQWCTLILIPWESYRTEWR